MKQGLKRQVACLLIGLMVTGCGSAQPLLPEISPSPVMKPSPLVTASQTGDCPRPLEWDIEFQRDGGIMGLSQALKITDEGKVQAQNLQTGDSFDSKLAPNEIAEFEDLLMQACPFETGRLDQNCADCFVYSMSIKMDGGLFRVKVADNAIPQDLQPLIQTLSILLQQSLTP